MPDLQTEPLSLDNVRETGLSAMLQRIADGLSLAASYLAVACIVALAGLVLAEIVVALLARLVPGVPSGIGIAWEYSAYLMGGAFMLGAGMTLRAGLQIRVELLLRAGQGKYARLLEFSSSLIGAIVTVFLAWSMVAFTLRSYSFGEVSQDSFTPLWPAQGLLALGAVVLALQMIARVLSCMLGHKVDKPELGAATAIEG
jgi:TRAP-type mannitol/chloroaromatic compound transport system permease small subunit